MQIFEILLEIKRLNMTSLSMKEGQKKSFWEEFTALRDKQEAKISHTIHGFMIEIEGRIYVNVSRHHTGLIFCTMQSHRQKIYSNDPFPMSQQDEATKFYEQLEEQIPYS